MNAFLSVFKLFWTVMRFTCKEINRKCRIHIKMKLNSTCSVGFYGSLLILCYRQCAAIFFFIHLMFDEWTLILFCCSFIISYGTFVQIYFVILNYATTERKRHRFKYARYRTDIVIWQKITIKIYVYKTKLRSVEKK